MSSFTERHGMRTQIERTYDIDLGKYGVLLRCCDEYFDNIAWKYPDECEDGRGCCGLNDYFAEIEPMLRREHRD